MPDRLIDLRVDWLLQYAGETTTLPRSAYPDVSDRLGQVAGYLQATSAAVVSLSRSEADWAGQSDRWAALDDLIARVEAEFSGRILRDPIDLDAWAIEPESLTWALIGIASLAPLVRSEADLDRLDGLVHRGVRLFGLGEREGPLPELDRAILGRLAGLALPETGPRPIIDLAGLGGRSVDDLLAWFEADPERPRRLELVSTGPPLALDGLRRFRALGGTVGLTVSPAAFPDQAALTAEIERIAEVPFLGQTGHGGIAIATGFLGVETTQPGLANAEEIVGWVKSSLPAEVAEALLGGGASRPIDRSIRGLGRG